MKLRNPTNRVVLLKLRSGTIVLKPNEYIEASMKIRLEAERFMKQFGLRWELDDNDLPPGTKASNYAGTYAFSEEHKNDMLLDSKSVKNQNDSEEISDVWSSVIRHEYEEPETEKDEEMEDLIFIKKTVEDETVSERNKTREASSSTGTDRTEETIDEAQKTLQSEQQAESYEEVSEEGPDYLRETPPEGVSGFGEDVVKQTEYQKIHYEIAPESSPYTKSELMLGVKSRLWEICDELGLNNEGTKSDLINRIFRYYDCKSRD